MDGKHQSDKVGTMDLILTSVTEPVELYINGFKVTVGNTWVDKRGEHHTIMDIANDDTDLFPIKTMYHTFSRLGSKYSVEPIEGDLDVLDYYIEPTVCDEETPTQPFKLEDIVLNGGENTLTINNTTINIGMTPYESSLKTTKLDLSTEITGLIENNGNIKEIILKVKKLKKLLEL